MPRKVFVAGEILTASDVNTNLADQSVMVFDDATARATAIPTPLEGMVTYLKDTDVLEVFSGSAFVNFGSSAVASFRFVQTLYFASSGTFTKADFPWLRAIRVQCQAAGGGGGGTPATGLNQYAAGRGGTGGAFVESFLTNIAGLDASVTVTRGAGGAGGAVGANSGGAGGISSFGALVSANGGLAGGAGLVRGNNIWTAGVEFSGSFGTGQFGIPGGGSSGAVSTATTTANGIISSAGGGSHFAPMMGQRSTAGAENGAGGQGAGAGGGGAFALNNQTARAGGAGANGIVIIELFA